MEEIFYALWAALWWFGGAAWNIWTHAPGDAIVTRVGFFIPTLLGLMGLTYGVGELVARQSGWPGLSLYKARNRALTTIMQVGIGGSLFLVLAASILLHWLDADALPALVGEYLVPSLAVSLVALTSAYILRRIVGQAERLGFDRLWVLVLECLGLGVWFGAGVFAILLYTPDSYMLSGLMIFLALSVLVGEWLGAWLAWPALRLPVLGLWPALILLLLSQIIAFDHPFAQFGLPAWILALAVNYWMLYRRDGTSWQPIYHAGGLWLIAIVGTLESHWWVAGSELLPASSWAQVAWVMVPAALIGAIVQWGKGVAWPIGRHWGLYLQTGLAPLAAFSVLWVVWINVVSDGDSTPLPYLPLLNPVGIVQLAVLGCLALWIRRLQQFGIAIGTVRVGYGVIVGLLFLWLNAGLARMAHQIWNVTMTVGSLLTSPLLQAVYSLVWSLLALTLMFYATRRGARWVWILGAALLTLVVLKLFAVDLSNAGTLARIVSFIGVGLLMLVIGFFAPVPPGAAPPDARETG